MFKTFDASLFIKELQMGNIAYISIAGLGVAELHFTSVKKLTFLNVLFVSDLRKNFVFVDLFCKKEFWLCLRVTKLFFKT